MSGRTYDLNAATVVIDGVTLPAPRMIFRTDPHAEAIVEARASGALRIRAAVLGRLRTAILLGVIDDGGPTPRGCFHNGCDTAESEEGGSHWCRWST